MDRVGATSGLSVLVVDDEEDIRRVLRRQLEKAGHRVETACDGASAVGQFVTGRFDVVVTDLVMPGTRGVELVKRVKTIDPETITIVLTGFGSLETAIEVMREGCDDYLLKPMPSLDHICRVVDRCRARRQIRRIASRRAASAAVEDDLAELVAGEAERRLGELQEHAASSGSRPGANRHEPRNVLIVDTDDDFLEIVSWALLEHGCEVATASTAAQALEMIPPGRFDAVIAERRLPDMDGADFIRRMREKAPGVPVVLVSAYAGSLERSRPADLGAVEVLPKPVKVATLVSLLDSLGARAAETTGHEKNSSA
jgi:DNA-binding NtrC family response regulator